MGKEQVKVKADTVECSKRLDRFEQINFEELQTLTNNAIAGLAPVEIRRHLKKAKLISTLAGQISLSAYLAYPADTATLLSLIDRTLSIAIACERYGLRPDNLCWDFDHVFVDSVSGEITMIYWPVIRPNYSTYEMLSFYASFVDLMNQNHADPDVFRAYQQYFYQRNTINLFSFRNTIQNIYEEWQMARNQRRENGENPNVPANDVLPGNLVNAWLQSGSDPQKIWLTKDQMLFGRDRQSCDVAIDHDSGVSRVHAMVIKRKEKYYLVDLGSTNGTFMNGTQIAPQIMVPLEDEAVFRLAGSEFSFHVLNPDLTVPIFW